MVEVKSGKKAKFRLTIKDVVNNKSFTMSLYDLNYNLEDFQNKLIESIEKML